MRVVSVCENASVDAVEEVRGEQWMEWWAGWMREYGAPC